MIKIVLANLLLGNKNHVDQAKIKGGGTGNSIDGMYWFYNSSNPWN